MFREFLAPPGQPVSAWGWVGKVAVYIAFVIWGLAIIRTPLAETGALAMHCVNLPFHEAGHIIFSFDGRFLEVLGGSLLQVLVPLVILVAFLVKNRDQFAASIMLWWLGQNFLDLAPYIADARAGEMILLGGVTGKEVPDYHDWEYLLRTLGWLKYDQFLGRLSFFFGSTLMVLACLWGGAVLWAQGLTRWRRRPGP